MSEIPADRADPPYLLRGRFGNFEELAEATRGWDLDFHQLDRGASPAELVQLAEPQTSILRARLGRRYHQRGSSPPGTRTFALLEEGVAGVLWCGRNVTETSLMTFHPGGDFEGVSPPGFEVYTLSFSEDQLAETAAMLGLPEIPDLMGDEERKTTCDGPALQDLRCRLRLLCSGSADGPSPLGASSLRQELDFEIPGRLLGALAASRAEAPRPPFRTRDLALKRARSFIEENGNRPLPVREVCRAAGVSWRTLDYAFREHFGVTPKAYLKATRLGAVRRELRRVEPHLTIADAANRWGFWHMGQFAADYRTLFGELPSETLKGRTRSSGPSCVL